MMWPMSVPSRPMARPSSGSRKQWHASRQSGVKSGTCGARALRARRWHAVSRSPFEQCSTGLRKCWNRCASRSESNKATGQEGKRRIPSLALLACGLLPRWGESTLGELEALASALAAVFLAFLHAAVAGQVTGITQKLAHAACPTLAVCGLAIGSAGSGSGQAKHLLDPAGAALAGGSTLTSEPTAADRHRHVHALAEIRHIEGAIDGVAVLFLGEVLFNRAAIDRNLASALRHADTGHRGLAPAGAQVVRLLGLRFGHGLFLSFSAISVLPAAGPGEGASGQHRS